MATNDCKPLPALTEADIARFWAKVDVRGPDECWPWIASLDDRGYGQLGFRRERVLVSSRIAYFLHYGVDPFPLLVCHTCDNRPCCNGKHLFKGTHQDNHDDMRSKGRGQRGEAHGLTHFTDENVRQIRDMYATGLYSQISIGATFGVNQTTISAIVNRRRWKHI